MKLSELQTGEKAVVVKVLGHGGFRKRIVEMGFIRGKIVESLLNAPLKDPVKYRIMGYEISLRRDEASMIEIIPVAEAEELIKEHENPQSSEKLACTGDDERLLSYEDKLRLGALRKRRTINVALVGNPNCGKTSLFNFASGAHERVGNYSGVTVDAKEGHASFEGYEFNIVDLPGTYSLTAYTPEEMYVRRQIIDKTPDIIINVIDASNLERNLYLTTQLIDMNVRMVCALNMYDELEKRGDTLDREVLSNLLGVPMVPTVFKTGAGVKSLFHVIINMYEGLDFVDEKGNIDPEIAGDIRKWHDQLPLDTVDDHHLEDFASEHPKNNVARHIHINHGQYVEKAIDAVKALIQPNTQVRYKYSTRYLAIKLLENDEEAIKVVSELPNAKEIMAAKEKACQDIKDDVQTDSETAIMDAKYGFIRGALSEAGYKMGNAPGAYAITHKIDAVVTNKWIGLPLFFVMLFLVFQITFSLGQYPMDWIDAGVAALGDLCGELLPDGPVKDMIVDGCIGGVGAVIVFLPQILILYFFIALMEDSGYMARAAFIMDKFMHKMGLHGKSFIPLMMGFGCNVPAIMSTRTIESRRSRLVTMLVVPMMSCSARLPIYIMIVGTFFAVQYQSLVLLSLYALGIVMAIVMSKVFCKFLIKDEDTPFVMELPPYRFPTAKALARHTWERGKQYLKKMGGIILVASIVVWVLSYFPHNEELNRQEQQEQSYIGRLGQIVEPVFRPQGFSWKQDVGIISGIGAKEIVASTLGVLYTDDESFADDDSFEAVEEAEEEGASSKYAVLRAKMESEGANAASAYAFLVFVLLYFPCLATIAAIKGETGSWKWAIFTCVYTTALAWVVSFVVYQIGCLFL